MNKERVMIDISAKTVIKIILIGLFFVFLFLVRDILLIVLTAVVIASAIEPLTLWFGRRGVRRTLAVVIIYLTLAVFFLGFVYLFLPKLLSDLAGYLTVVSDLLASGGFSEFNPVSDNAARTTSLLGEVTTSASSIGEIFANVNGAVSSASESLLATIRFVFGGVAGFILIIVLSFYMAVKDDGIADFLRIITPLKHEKYVIGLWRRTQEKIGYWMQGQLILAVMVGLLVYAGLFFLGVEHALLLAFIAGIFELIPIFGPILSAIPAILIAGGEHGIPLAIGVAALYILIQQLENHLIYPLVVKKIVGLSPIIVIIALIVGAKLGGFLGILLSVPVSAALVEFFRDVEKGKHVEETPPAA